MPKRIAVKNYTVFENHGLTIIQQGERFTLDKGSESISLSRVDLKHLFSLLLRVRDNANPS